MDIKTYLKQHNIQSRRDLAEAAGTKLIYLRQISTGLRKVSADLAVRLEHASGGLITAYELRPDLPWPRAPCAQPPSNPPAPLEDAA